MGVLRKSSDPCFLSHNPSEWLQAVLLSQDAMTFQQTCLKEDPPAAAHTSEGETHTAFSKPFILLFPSFLSSFLYDFISQCECTHLLKWHSWSTIYLNTSPSHAQLSSPFFSTFWHIYSHQIWRHEKMSYGGEGWVTKRLKRKHISDLSVSSVFKLLTYKLFDKTDTFCSIFYIMYNDIYYAMTLYLWDSDFEAFSFDIGSEDYANLILVKISQLGKWALKVCCY